MKIMNNLLQINFNPWPIGLLAIFSLASFAATIYNILPLWGGLIFFSVLVLVDFAYPTITLIILVVLTIIVPVDLAIKLGDLPRIGPVRVFLGAFFLGLLLHRLYYKYINTGTIKFPFIILISFFLFVSIVSTIFSVSFLQSIYTILCLSFEQYLLFYIMLYFVSLPNFWPRLKIAIFCVTAVICIFAFYEELSRNNPLLFLYPQEEALFRGEILRVRSTLFHPIALGCYLNLVFPFVFIEIIEDKPKLIKLA